MLDVPVSVNALPPLTTKSATPDNTPDTVTWMPLNVYIDCNDNTVFEFTDNTPLDDASPITSAVVSVDATIGVTDDAGYHASRPALATVTLSNT